MTAFLRKSWQAIDHHLFGKRRLAPVYNVTRSPNAQGRKSALLVYLTQPFHVRADHSSFRNHQNRRQAVLIAATLGEFGYVVDVAHWEDRSFRPAHSYDLVVSHRVDHAGLEMAFGARTLKIYLSSGLNHVVRNQNFRARLDSLIARRGCRLTEIIWDVEEMPFLEIADAQVGFGNRYTMAMWSRNFSGPTFSFENFGVCGGQAIERNWEEARKRFFFFGSTQQLGKGLDLLLEIFPKHPELDLYICSRYANERDFSKCYARELFETRNIHACGWVDIAGREFRELAGRCAYVILPTCSDACPGSVANAISAGLIPIVTQEAGLDTGDFGFMLEDASLEAIERMIMEVSELAAVVAERSQLALRAADERLSEKAFRRRWHQIMSEIHARFVASKTP